MQKKRQKTIYFDGDCTMCSTIMQKVDNSPESHKFCKVNFKQDPIPKEFNKDVLNKDIHVVEKDGKVYKNFDAILKVLEEFPKLRYFVLFARLPIIKNILTFGYNLLSINRHFILGPLSRLFWLKATVAIGLIFALLLTSKLWLTDRLYPLIPFIPGFPPIPAPFDYLVYAILLLLLIAVIVVPKPQKLIYSISAIFAILAFTDQSRWQAFMYQYVFLLLCVGLFSWNYKDSTNASKVLNIARLIIICTYFWSGLQKLNFGFISGVFPWFIDPLIRFLPQNLQDISYFSGFFIPFVEMGMGIGLLFARTRNLTVLIAIGMHLSILCALGPFGHNWGIAIWPWNIIMIVFDLLLFWKVKSFSFKDVFWIRDSIFHKIVLLLFGIMPFLSLFNLWDSYLSFTLYSGNTKEATIYISESVEKALPSEIKKYTEIKDNKTTINVLMWPFRELGVGPYPETRAYKVVGKKICEYAQKPSDVILIVKAKPTLFNRDKQASYTCDKL